MRADCHKRQYRLIQIYRTKQIENLPIQPALILPILFKIKATI
jgi:predicted metalloprotease